jgi:hypothetical protein
MFAFLSLLFVLLVIFVMSSASNIEGFDAPAHTVTLPAVPPPTSLLPDKKAEGKKAELAPEPHTLPGQLPVAPYQQIASSNPLPYQDTTQIKANRQQLLSLLEMMKGFLANEAQELSERSDPSIQLPLGTARSDFQILQNAVTVINRNPGLQPTITLTNLNDMATNLSFLQEQVRLSGAAGTLQGPVYQFTEGFADATKQTSATLEQLTDFVKRVNVEIRRLSASGTTDPNIQARISGLTKMKTDVQAIIDKVNQNQMVESRIPIMEEDIKAAFRVLGKSNEPLPQLIRASGLSSALGNMLPSNTQNDPETTAEIKRLITTYSSQLLSGNPKSCDGPSTVAATGFPSIADISRVSEASTVHNTDGRFTTDRLAAHPFDAGRGPAHFDWKERSKEIESQIQKRGLKPTDFGVMPKDAVVSKEFSWKGYARMICNRLQATLDPALPETCGCPPMDWKGWRISK